MEALRLLWQRLCADFRDLLRLLRGEEPEPLTLGDMLKMTLPQVPTETVDWFVWECEQYAASPVFWFNHWRYEGTEWAYPDPTNEQRIKVWNASLRRAIAEFGEAHVRAQGQRLAAKITGTMLEDIYFRQPDPWAWVMRQAVH